MPEDFVHLPGETPPPFVTCLDGDCELTSAYERPTNSTVVLHSAEPNRAAFRVAYYPEWQVTVNDQEHEYAVDDRGRIVVSVPSGTTQISLRLENTQLRSVSDGISALSLLAFLTYFSGLLIKKRV